MQHFFQSVPKLGHVAVSRHAQARCEELGITEEQFCRALLEPARDVPDGQEVLWRERDNIRLVVQLFPTPNRGARLISTVYLIKPTARARRG
jgi:hypothetical protein